MLVWFFAIFILLENIVSLKKILREDEKTFRGFCPQRRQDNWAGGKQGGKRWHWSRSDAVTGAANASPALEREGERGALERGGAWRAANAVKELRRRGHCHLQLAVNNTLSLVQLLFSSFVVCWN